MSTTFALLGHHRSGTSFINDWLAEHPSFDTINEPFSLHTLLSPNDYDYVSGGSQSHLCRGLGTVADFSEDLAHWLAASAQGFRGFKETAFFFQYSSLKHRLRINQTLLIFRNPKAVVASLIRRQLHSDRWGYDAAARLHFRSEYDSIEAAGSPVRLCALLWKKRASCLLDISKESGSRIVRLEDMVLKPQETATEIMHFFGEEVSKEQHRFLEQSSKATHDSTYSYKRKKEDVLDRWSNVLTLEECAFLDDYLSDQLAELGYQNARG